MLNVFSTLRSAICAPINFATTQIGNLFSKIKSVVAPIFNSIGSFFYSSAIYQRCASLYGRVTVGNIEERQELLKILDAWHPDCPEEEKTRVTREIIDCYNQRKTSITFDNISIDSLPNVFALGGFANLTSFTTVTCCRLTTLPESVGNLRALKRLELKGCSSLAALPESIGNLRALIFLNLTGCSSLAALPESIGNLRVLILLDLTGCSSLAALPESLGNLRALTGLNLTVCSSLAALPESIGNLTGLTCLSLWGCRSLAALPESIGNLRALTVLYLLGCFSLAALPESIGNLRALTDFNLLCCLSLTGLPNAILSLPSTCSINITGCRFSQEETERLSAATSSDDYRGPQIQYSMQVPRTAAVEQSLAEWLTSTFRNANLEEEALPNLLALDESNRLTIATWLSRMTDTADANSAGKTGFYQLILNYLKLANENGEFREVFLQVLHGASTTCGDRVSLSVLHLGIAAKKITCDKTDLKAYAELLKGLIALGLLEEFARAKVETLSLVDEIEVYLGYPVMLKEALNLPIDIEEMRFFGCSRITPEDLREAEGHVLAQVGTQEALLNQLVKNNDWLNALKAKHPTEFTSIVAARDAASDSDDADYDAIGRVYIQALIDLSRRALA